MKEKWKRPKTLVILLGCLLLSLVLSGCGGKKERLQHAIDRNTSVLLASTNIDTLLLESLLPLAEEESYEDKDHVLNLVLQAKKSQEQVLGEIRYSEGGEGEDVSFSYQALIQQRILSYNNFLHAIQQGDPSLLAKAIDQHTVKDVELSDKTLTEVNRALRAVKGTEKDSLYPDLSAKKES